MGHLAAPEIRYRVAYAHSVDGSDQHGYGMQEVTVDHEITDGNEIIEIARQIGLDRGYTHVGIIKIEQAVTDPDG